MVDGRETGSLKRPIRHKYTNMELLVMKAAIAAVP